MPERNVILAVVEPDVIPQEVVGRAAWLAERTGSDLTLLLCDADVTALANDFFVSSETKEIARNMRSMQQEMLEDLAEPVRARNLRVQLEVLEERPVAAAVLQRALELDPRFVIKGTQYHSTAQRATFVDTDWSLVRTCPYPLWLVKPHELSAQPLIIAAVDAAPEEKESARVDQAIVKQARAVASAAGGEVHLLHACQPLKGIGAEATRTFKPIHLPVDELSRQIAEDARRRLDALASANGIAESHTHQLPGPPREVIPFVARDRKADLVVMGAVARWSRQREVIGSTAEKVLDHLPCDILIIRPD